jgi:S-adenosylmethionine-dependent methyltransferase
VASHPAGAPAPTGTRTNVRTAVVWDYLRAAIDSLDAGRDGLQVLDAGGGSGGFAVPLAQLGHRVTVVDPSPDSLAALERRAAETGTEQRITAVQGDAAGLDGLVPAAGFHLALCHSVLEVVDEPDAALRALARTLRPEGQASILAANRTAAVVHRVASGRLSEARQLLDGPAGTAGTSDSLLRRFTFAELQLLLTTAGLRPRTVHGVRVFTDAAPSALLDGDPAAVEELLALERAAAEKADYLSLATQLHVLAGVD